VKFHRRLCPTGTAEKICNTFNYISSVNERCVKQGQANPELQALRASRWIPLGHAAGKGRAEHTRLSLWLCSYHRDPKSFDADSLSVDAAFSEIPGKSKPSPQRSKCQNLLSVIWFELLAKRNMSIQFKRDLSSLFLAPGEPCCECAPGGSELNFEIVRWSISPAQLR